MTVETQKDIEKRFTVLKRSYSEEQWINVGLLNAEVDILTLQDIVLSCRLMQHVKNLSPTEQNQAKLKKLQSEAFSLNSEPAMVLSSELTLNKNPKKTIQLMLDDIYKTFSHKKIKKWLKPIVLLVFIPFLLFAFYQIVLASPRFESQAKFIVKEPNGMATLDPTMAMMSGFGITSGGGDTQLVKFFIYSNDMLNYLESSMSIRKHFSNREYDMVSRLSYDASTESLFSYYLSKVKVDIDENSQVVSLHVQAFTPEFANKLNQAVVKRAEWYINEIGHNLAKAQLQFVQQEHELVQQKVRTAKADLLEFQRRYDLLDPQAEGTALQQITYRLEAEVTAKRTELRMLRTSMSNDAPMVMQAESELISMVRQLDNERNRLTNNSNSKSNDINTNSGMSVGEILAKFSDYKINMDLALRSYTSSQVSLEKSRIEAYRQLKYLVVVESPTLPDSAKYPNVQYNLALSLALLLMFFGIGKIILATVDEMR
jgi:capsular polysaccharide transport system permease protein